MSAPQIPNLFSSRGGPRSRGRGRGRSGPQSSTYLSTNPNTPSRRNLAVQSTDTDAAVSRLSAVSLGYLTDEYAAYFVAGTGTRRLPIINRGTYTRTTALDILIEKFIADATPGSLKQIVSLGAGTDTRYLRLLSQNRARNLIYHEFDFASVCASKLRILEANRHWVPGCSIVCDADAASQEEEGTQKASDKQSWQIRPSEGGESGYWCHGMDLRDLPAISELGSLYGLRSDIPTLIISECCLCYLEVSVASQVLQWFGDRIPDLGIVLYEPIGGDDAFGRMMVENLAARGIVMPTVRRYKGLEEQRQRLVEAGFGSVGAVTVEEVWDRWIGEGERERVDGLEGLDEVEEWQMLARHYAVAWGWKGRGWDGWEGLRGG